MITNLTPAELEELKALVLEWVKADRPTKPSFSNPPLGLERITPKEQANSSLSLAPNIVSK